MAFIGKNGAGKSTMAKLLCGIIRPDRGEICIEGENYLQYSIKEIGEKSGMSCKTPIKCWLRISFGRGGTRLTATG